MYLVYADETGTNFSEKSPYLIYGGLIVHETKLDILELQLQKMIAKFLKLNDLRKVELHTSEIFDILFRDNHNCTSKKTPKKQKEYEALKEQLKNVSVDDFIIFTDELIQFLVKVDIPLRMSIIDKNATLYTNHYLNKEVGAISYAFKIFLNLIDRYMATKNEKALLIIDNFENQIPKNITSLNFCDRIKDENIKTQKGAIKELVILRTLYESINWKFNCASDLKELSPLKYKFESQNLFLVDNINYTNSKDSIINQVADFLLFIFKKVVEINTKSIEDNQNLLKLADKIDRSIYFAIGEKVISIGELNKENDISFISTWNGYSFKEISNALLKV